MVDIDSDQLFHNTPMIMMLQKIIPWMIIHLGMTMTTLSDLLYQAMPNIYHSFKYSDIPNASHSYWLLKKHYIHVDGLMVGKGNYPKIPSGDLT